MTVDQMIDGVIEREGGYVEDAADHGGPTRYGITLRTLADWRHPVPVTAADVAQLGLTEARAIYHRMYVEAPGFDAIPDERLRALVVDYAVLSGPRAATAALQRAMGIHDDGVLGGQTKRLLVAQAGSPEVYKRLLAGRITAHVEIVLLNPGQRKFLRGWLARIVGFLCVALCAAPVAAGEPTPLRWASHAAVPARVSDGLVAAQIGLAAVDAWRADDRRHALGCLALRNGLAIGATELLKRALHRTRPDASDNLSFPSGHTALATVNGAAGWRYGLTVGVGWGRQAAGRHYATDVLAGAGIGWLAQHACHVED